MILKWLKHLRMWASTQSFSKGLRLFLAVLLVIILAVLLINITDFSHEYGTYNAERPLVSTAAAWVVEEVGDEQYLLRMKLPDKLPDYARLGFETDHQTIVATINGLEVYRRKPDNPWYLGHEVGRVWNMITIPSEYGGETITLEIDNYAGMRLFTHTSFIGSYAQVSRYFLFDVLPSVLTIAFAMALSTFLLISAFAMKQKGMKQISNGAVYLGIALVILSIQVITDSYVVQILEINLALSYILAQVLYLIIPILFMQYLRSQVNRFGAILDFLSFCQIVYLAFVLYMHFHGYLYIVQAQPQVRMNLLICILVTAAISIQALVKSDPEQDNRIAISSILFVDFAACGVILYYVFVDGNMNVATAVLFIEFVFIGMQALEFLKKTISAFVGAAEGRGLRKLAYEDAMTGLYNRTAFDRDVANVNFEIYKYHSVGALVMDLNNLKETNDDLGHYEGDFLIVSAAQLIQKTFGQIGKAYRYGGDEFIVFLMDEQIPKMPEVMAEFNKDLESYNAKHDVPISISWGFSSITVTEEEPGDTLLKRLISKADERMYSYKRQQAIDHKRS